MKIVHDRLFVFLFGFLVFFLFILSPPVVKKVFAHEESQAGAEISQMQGTPVWAEPIPTPSISSLAESEIDRFVAAASVFTHPDTRLRSESPVNAKTLLDTPTAMDGYQVVVKGKVVNIYNFPASVLEDWPRAYVLIVDDGSAWIPVVYRGSLHRIDIGTSISASGQFVAAGSTIHADVVRGLISTQPWLRGSPPGMLPVLIASILLGVIAVAVMLFRKFSGLFALSFLLLAGLSACELHIENTIEKDGTVKTAVYFSEMQENVDFLREIPGIRRYIAGWLTELRAQGLSVDNWIEGDREYFILQQDHADLESFSALNEELDTADSWTYATSYPVGDEQCFRFIAQVQPQMLYTIPPDTDSAVVNEFNKYLNRMQFTYAVSLPGRITYSNSSQVNANRVYWQVDMKRANQFVAESCSSASSYNNINWSWGWLAIGGIASIDLGLWLLAFRKHRVKSTVSQPERR